MRGVTNYIGTPDLAATATRILLHGGRIIRERTEIPGEGTFLLFQDPDGIRAGVHSKPARRSCRTTRTRHFAQIRRELLAGGFLMSDTTTQGGSEQGSSGGVWSGGSSAGSSAGSSTPGGSFSVHGRNHAQGIENKMWSEYNRWQGWGRGTGDTHRRTVVEDTGDLDNTEIAAPKLAQADLTGIKTTTVGQRDGDNGGGYFHDSTFGTFSSAAWRARRPPASSIRCRGLHNLDLYNARVGGGRARKTGVRGQVSAQGQYGSAVAKGEAYGVAEAGADGNLKISTRDGIRLAATPAPRLGVGASGDADLKTPGLRVQGVDTPLDAGVGAATARRSLVSRLAPVRASVRVQISSERKAASVPSRVSKRKGDIHANLGPLRGRVTASGMAGAGIGADGGITYENGKIKISGRVYAALGLGGSLGGEVTLDVSRRRSGLRGG